jgi:hypothetical protein
MSLLGQLHRTNLLTRSCRAHYGPWRPSARNSSNAGRGAGVWGATERVHRYKAGKKATVMSIVHPVTEADRTCQTVDSDVHYAHYEPLGLAGRRKS